MLKEKKTRCRAADLILADINNNYEIDSSTQSEQSNDGSSDVAGAFDNSSILSSTLSLNSDVSSFEHLHYKMRKHSIQTKMIYSVVRTPRSTTI